MPAKHERHDYFVAVEYMSGEKWVFIRHWNDDDEKAFWKKESAQDDPIKSLYMERLENYFPCERYPDGRWFRVCRRRGE